MRHLPVLALACVSACALVDPPEPPASVGKFAVTGTLESNTCGFAAMPMPSTYEVNAELTGVAGGMATWKWESQGTIVNGAATSRGVYTFSTRTQMPMIAPDPFYGIAGCTLEQRSEIVVTVDPIPEATDGGVSQPEADGGVGTRTLAGTYTVDLYPIAGSDCSGLLGANGGNFQVVPCQSKSKLAGELAN